MKDESMISKILKSIFFRKATGKAGRWAKNSSKLFELAKDALSKANKKGFREGLGEASTQVALLARMVRAYASGEYRALPWKSVVSIIAVLIYFVSPIDLIPDFLPVIGISDDIALVVWLFNSLGNDIRKFGEWEKNEKTINIG